MRTLHCLFRLFLNSLLLTVFISVSSAQFVVPEATVEPLSPRGFRVSIPDVEGIKLFAFHGKLNEEFDGQEGGTFSRDILRAKDGRWTFTDKNTKLKAGDVLFYWLYVDWNDGERTLGYTRHWQEYKVTDLVPSPDTQSCNVKTATTFNGKSICAGIAFKDEFALNKVNEASWIIEQYIPTFKEPGFEFCSYQNRPENVFIDDGNLFLKPIARTRDDEVRGTLDLTDKCTSELVRQDCYYVQKSAYIIPPASSSQIISNFTMKYGRIDVKAKLSRGDWIFSEFALIPIGRDPNEKVVFAFSRGNLDLKSIKTGIDIGLGLLYAEVCVNNLHYLANTTSERFYTNIAHTYSIDWTPGSIKFLVDDVEFGNVNSNTFDTEARLRLTAGVGGFRQFPDDITSGKNEKPWKNNDRKSLVKFFDSRNEWLPTWKGNDVAVKIESVTITAK